MIQIANFEQHSHKFLDINQHMIYSFLPLLLLITMLGYFSSFSKAFDSIEAKHAVIIHKRQEQLGCNSCSSPLSLVLKDLVYQTSLSWKPSKSDTRYIWAPNFGSRMVHNPLGFHFIDCWFT
jgi:hypothetical protein